MLAVASAVVRERDSVPESGQIPKINYMDENNRPLGNRGEYTEEMSIFERSDKMKRTPPSTPNLREEAKKIKEKPEDKRVDMKMGEDTGSKQVYHIFERSGKTKGTPPSSTKVGEEAKKVEERPEDKKVGMKIGEDKGGRQVDSCSSIERRSPLSDKIGKHRREEDEQINRCKNILKKMLAVVGRQKNVSIDIKKGILELEDALNNIDYIRKACKEAEMAAQGLAPHDHEVVSMTPVGRKKRGASSPLEQETDKKKKEIVTRDDRHETQVGTPQQWEKVERKRTKKQRNKAQVEADKMAKGPSTKTEKKGTLKIRRRAITIKPGESKSYAQVLREIKDKIVPEDVGAEIKAIRQTREGHVLLELGNRTEDPERLRNALATALGDTGLVKTLATRKTLEIRDLDCLTEKKDVEEALRRDLQDTGEMKVNLTAINPREQRAAIVELEDRLAAKLLKQARIRIGWIYCRVRERAIVQKCYKCHGYGHLAKMCRGPDRSRLCLKCGLEGHRWKECSAPELCTLCTEKGLEQSMLAHLPGSGRCKVFRDELEKARKLLR